MIKERLVVKGLIKVLLILLPVKSPSPISGGCSFDRPALLRVKKPNVYKN